MDTCQYRDLFGPVGTGVHSYRFMNIAIVDVFLTIVLAYLISKGCLHFGNKVVSTWRVFAGLFVFAQFLHWMLCVPTTFMVWLESVMYPPFAFILVVCAFVMTQR